MYMTQNMKKRTDINGKGINCSASSMSEIRHLFSAREIKVRYQSMLADGQGS